MPATPISIEPPLGLNEWLAQEVGVLKPKVLIPGEGEGVGLGGRVGRIPETTLGELALRLAELWSTPVRMVGGDPKLPLQTAAVVGGSGGEISQRRPRPPEPRCSLREMSPTMTP